MSAPKPAMPRDDGAETVDIRYSRGRNAIIVVFCAVTAMACALALNAAEGTGVRVILTLTLAIFVLATLRAGWLTLGPGGPALSIGAAGIHIHRPALGLIPWERIAAIELWGLMSRKNQLRIRFVPPPPPLPRAAILYYGLPQLLSGDGSFYNLALFQIAAPARTLFPALAAHWPELDAADA